MKLLNYPFYFKKIYNTGDYIALYDTNINYNVLSLAFIFVSSKINGNLVSKYKPHVPQIPE